MSQTENSEQTVPWSSSERVLLDWLLDEILPATADGVLPAGGALGIARHIAERVRDTPSFGALIAVGLRKTAALLAESLTTRGIGELHALSPAERTELARAIEAAEPTFFAALIKHAYMGYYTHSRIPPLMGLPDRPPQPLGHKVPKDSVAELHVLLAPVLARGKRYRDVE